MKKIEAEMSEPMLGWRFHELAAFVDQCRVNGVSPDALVASWPIRVTTYESENAVTKDGVTYHRSRLLACVR